MSTFTNFAGHSLHAYEESVLPDINIDSLVMDESVEPCFEDNFLVAGARVCAENTINMNNIFQAAAIQEFCYLEETGTEMLYEAENGGGFIEKAKSFFLKLWEKIKSIFKKAALMFASKAKTDKEFLNKYKKDLNEARNKGYGDKEISIYKYKFYDGGGKDEYKAVFSLPTILNNYSVVNDAIDEVLNQSGVTKNAWDTELGKLTATNAQSDSDEVKNAMKKLDEYVKTINESDWKADKVYDVVRQEFVKNAGNNSASATSASDFVADLTEAIQGNDTAKDDVGMSEAVNYAVNFLDNSNAIQKGLDAGLKEWKHNIDTTVKTLTTQQKTWIKNNRNDVTLSTRAVNYKHSALSAAIQVMQTTKNIGITAHTTAITCLKACSGQSKSICVQALNYKKPKNESTSLEGDYSSSLLESVELI